MNLTSTDWIGFIGVAILLLAFLLQLLQKISRDGMAYLGMNVIGAAMACIASYLIHYMPFVLLEGTWTLVSLIALINHAAKNNHTN